MSSLVRIVVSFDGDWKKTDQDNWRFTSLKAKGLIVQKEITYDELVKKVSELLQVNCGSYKMDMKFIVPGMVSMPIAPIEIQNDDDVRFFISENLSNVDNRTPLCVTLVRISPDSIQEYGEIEFVGKYGEKSPSSEDMARPPSR
ncbi:hypothetical protein TorRG33x02_285140 [Trema orientale]|uniref:Uncharacterized protein n=1 Tax=Trema orientale TaxID=63057 RepID=A0A2P5CGW9_TREOI|nr:hypothetical protein TorRG33x02_285140 [Trema orientale]